MKKKRLLYVMLFVFAVFLSNRMFLGTAEAAWQAEKIGTASYPWGITIKGDNLYIANWSGQNITIMSKTGTLIKTIDLKPINADFKPIGIACDADYIYVINQNNNCLYKITEADNSYQVIINKSKSGLTLSGPEGITIDGGNIYIADYGMMKVYKTDTTGSFMSVAIDSSHLSAPSDVAVYGDYIYVTDVVQKSIVKMKKDGTDFQTVASDFDHICGIDIVGGKLYATESLKNSIYIDGNFYNAGMEQYDYGLGIAVDVDGSVYVGTSVGNIYHVAYQDLAPTVSNVSISGTLRIGEKLTGSYTYSDTEGDLEGTSTYQWYRSDTDYGSNKTPISGQTSINYTLTADDADKYISFEVTPVASTGVSPGTKVEGFCYAPVDKLYQEVINYSDTTKTYGDAAFSYTASGGSGSGTFSYYSSNTAIASIDSSSGLVTIHKAGTVTLTAYKGYDATYYPSQKNCTLTINKKVLTPSVTANAKTYDGTSAGTGSIDLTGKVGSDEVSASGTFTFDSASAGTGKTVSVSGIVLSGADKGNYTVSTAPSTTANISKAVLTTTVGNYNKSYGDTNPSFTVDVTGFVNGENAGTAAGYSAPTASTTATTTTKPSDVTITISGGVATNYSFNTSDTGILTIGKKALTATATANVKTYDGGTTASGSIALTGKVGSDAVSASGTFTFASAAAGTGKTVNVTGITLTGADKDNYTVADTTGTIANITAKTLTITATANAKTYDGTSAGTGSIDLTGKVGSDEVSASGTFTFASAAAGTGKTVSVSGIVLSGADKDNYTVSAPTSPTADINKVVLTAIATANAKTYDGGTTGSGSIALMGTIGSDAVSANGTFTFASAAVGTGKTVSVTAIVLSGADKDNYTVSTTTSTTADINKAMLTATVGDYSKIYGATNPSFTVGVTGFVNGENAGTAAGYSAPTASTTATTATKPSDVAITISGGAATNYSFNTTDTGILTIGKKALTTTATANAKTYDGGTTGSGSIVLTGTIGSDEVSASGTFTFASADAGTGKTVSVSGIVLSGADKDNYTVSAPTSPTADINKAVLTATVGDYSKTYGATNPSFTVDVTGFVNGENAGTAAGYSTPTASTTATTATNPSDVDITISGGVATNYSFNTTDKGKLTIEKKELTATASANAKTYDGGTTGSGSIALTGKVGSDAVSASGTFTFDSAAAGTGKDVNVTGIVLSGADKDNYTVNTTAVTTGVINKAVLTATVGDYSKTYGTTNPSFTVDVTGFVNGENAGTAEGFSAPTASTTATTETKPADVAITISGGAATNYSFNTTDTGILTIEKKALTAAATANAKTYDGGTTGSGSIALTGTIGSDSVGASGTFTFASATVGTGKTVNVTGITLTGADKNNYTVNLTATTTGTISEDTRTIAGYFKDSTGDDRALTTTASVAYGTEETTALAKLSSSGYAKLSDGSYVAVHINWTFDSTYNKNNSGDKSVTGTVSGTFIGGQIPANMTGTVTVEEMITPPVNNTPTGDAGSTPAKTEGTIEKDQKRDEGAPVATINNSSEDLKAKVLDSSERGKVAAGEDAKVILKIEDISNSVSEENKKLIEEKVKQELPSSSQQNLETTLLFVDISLFKQIGNGEETRVTEIHDKISISIEIPKELWNSDDNYNRTYKVVRIHDGVAEILEGTYDSEKHLFTFETDRFSTYALTYQDTTKSTGEDTSKTESVVSNDFYQLHLTAKAAQTTQTLSYARLSGVDGYLIYGAKCGKKMVELADVVGNVTSYTVKDLKQATYYKFQVIAYKIIDGKKYSIANSKLIYSITTSKTYGNPVKMTSKISELKLAVGATDTLTCKAVLSNGKKLKEYTSTIRYESTNKKIAIVNSDGKISAKSKGICYIYAYAQNGIYKKVKITVE